MRRLLMTAAACTLLMTSAQANDVDTASILFTLGLYDRDCATVPGLKGIINEAVKQMPAGEMQVGIDKATAQYQRAGLIKFCEVMKPFVTDFLNTLRNSAR